MKPEVDKALHYLYTHAMHSKLLSPVDADSVKKAAQTVIDAFKKDEVKEEKKSDKLIVVKE